MTTTTTTHADWCNDHHQPIDTNDDSWCAHVVELDWNVDRELGLVLTVDPTLGTGATTGRLSLPMDINSADELRRWAQMFEQAAGMLEYIQETQESGR